MEKDKIRVENDEVDIFDFYVSYNDCIIGG